MQATIRSWDAESGGSALLDDGTVLALPADVDLGPFRFLRAGQRVVAVVSDAGVVGLRLPGG